MAFVHFNLHDGLTINASCHEEKTQTVLNMIKCDRNQSHYHKTSTDGGHNARQRGVEEKNT